MSVCSEIARNHGPQVIRYHADIQKHHPFLPALGHNRRLLLTGISISPAVQLVLAPNDATPLRVNPVDGSADQFLA